jgi:hypothetical protein
MDLINALKKKCKSSINPSELMDLINALKKNANHQSNEVVV